LTFTLALVLSIYLLALLGVSFASARRVHNEEDYIVAGRRLPLWLAWGTLLATWFGAATVLGAAEAARKEGLRGTILDPFASGCALIVAGLFFAKPLWEMKLLTMADFYGRIYGKRAEVTAGLIMIPGYFGWIGAQYIALAGLQEHYFGIDERAGIVLAAGVILLYTLIGGMWSVTLTDTLQMFVILVTLVILGFVTFSQLGGGSVTDGFNRLITKTDPDRLTLLPQAGTAAAVAWTATWASGVFGNIPGQDLTQRIFASKDSTTAKRACILAGAIYIGFGLLPVGMGLASNILVPNMADDQTILGVLADGFLTPVTASIFIVALVSCIVSTATSAVLAPACILAHNLVGLVPKLERGNELEARKLLIDRLSVLSITLGGVAAAFSGKSILDLLELSLSIVVVTLFVPMVVGLFGKPRGEAAAIAAMIAGFAVWIARESTERFFLPVCKAAEAAGTPYADFIAQTHAAGIAEPFATLLHGFALFPSAISGTAASAAAYFLVARGKQHSRPLRQ
jgi:solute:Na+ symporter, SSS family